MKRTLLVLIYSLLATVMFSGCFWGPDHREGDRDRDQGHGQMHDQDRGHDHDEDRH